MIFNQSMWTNIYNVFECQHYHQIYGMYIGNPNHSDQKIFYISVQIVFLAFFQNFAYNFPFLLAYATQENITYPRQMPYKPQFLEISSLFLANFEKQISISFYWVCLISCQYKQNHNKMRNRKQFDQRIVSSGKHYDQLTQPTQNKDDRSKDKRISTFQTIEYKNAIYFGPFNDKNLRDGIGLIIFDSGDILLAEFSQNTINGHFYYFLFGKSLVFYGKIKDEKFDGNFYLMNRNQNYIQRVSRSGNSQRGCYAFDRCKVVTTYFSKNQEIIYFDNENKNHEKMKKLMFQPFLLTPTEYIRQYLSKIDASKFQLVQLSTNQLYFGLLHHHKPSDYGIIFQDEWPVCYGHFSEGMLNGLGRVQLSNHVILDGIFKGHSLNSGWIINLKKQTQSFGNEIQNDYETTSKFKIFKLDNKLFQIKQQISGIQISNLHKFRRQQHIQSLKYINSYVDEAETKYIIEVGSDCLKYLINPAIFSHGNEKQDTQQSFIPSVISQISYEWGRQRRETNYKAERDLLQLLDDNKNRNIGKNNSKFSEDQLKVDIDTDETQQQIQYEGQYKEKQTINKKINKVSAKEGKIQTNIQSSKKLFEGQSKNFNTSTHSSNAVIKLNMINSIKSQNQSKYATSDNLHNRITIQKKLNLHQIYSKYLKA